MRERKLARTPLCLASIGDLMSNFHHSDFSFSFIFVWAVTPDGLVAAEVCTDLSGEVLFWHKAEAEDLCEFEHAEIGIAFLPQEKYVELEDEIEDVSFCEIPVYRVDEKALAPNGAIFVTVKTVWKNREAHNRELAQMFLRNIYHTARTAGETKATDLAEQIVSLYGEEIGIDAKLAGKVLEKGLSYNKSRKEKGLPPKLTKAYIEPEPKPGKKYASKPKRGGRWSRNQANRD
jgi:hypothetical protein